LDRLGAESQRAYVFAESIHDLPLRATLLRAAYATQRRSDVWRQVQRIIASGQDAAPAVEPANMTQPLTAVEQRLAAASHASDWRRYLLLDEVREMARG
jgi:hypothetical protein